MIFQSATDMLKYVQDGNDIWSPTLEKYVFLYGELGSICCYSIDYEEAKELESKSCEFYPKEYWAVFLGIGGSIYDTLKWYEDAIQRGENFESNEIYNHALAFCKENYNNEWIDCYQVLKK